MEWKPTIGLEIHAELATKTKMFCRCKNEPLAPEPSINICPVCTAHPGTLPVINKEAVRQVLRVGLALGGTLADFTEFDRKNYFYPDIPKGYQISQYKFPLVSGGLLKNVRIRRVHLEEDTAKSLHDPKSNSSLVDFNRAGVPLMELVTEPDITSAKQAGDFARELQLLFWYLGASEANMEKGEMRVEANISVSRFDLKNPDPRLAVGQARSNLLGTKVEVKNLNSFRSVEGAIDYELKRQQEALEKGEKIVQETRGWDETKQITFSQREKESAHDYRYFPDPDLPKLKISEIKEFENLQETLPELPWAKRERLIALGIKAEDAEQYVADFALAQFFDLVEKELKEPALVKTASNFIANDVAGKRKKKPNWLPDIKIFTEVVRKYQAGELPSPQAKSSILNGTMAEVASAESLNELVEKIIAENPKVVGEYKAGKAASLQFLIGQGMKLSKGAANPQVLAKLFAEKLKNWYNLGHENQSGD